MCPSPFIRIRVCILLLPQRRLTQGCWLRGRRLRPEAEAVQASAWLAGLLLLLLLGLLGLLLWEGAEHTTLATGCAKRRSNARPKFGGREPTVEEAGWCGCRRSRVQSWAGSAGCRCTASKAWHGPKLELAG